MAERTTITQVTQIGVESTPGTLVAANKKLQSLFIEPSVSADVEMFRPMGSKYPTIQSENKEWVEASIGGEPTYTELIYLLSSVLSTASSSAQIMDGATPTGGYKWVFAPASNAADNPKTFSVEVGSSFRAHRFAYGLINELGLSFSRGDVSLDSSMIGTRLEDGITMTASPTAIELMPILPGQVDVFMDNTAAGLGTTKLARLLGADWKIGDRYNPLWVLDSTKNSWVAHLEKEPSLELVLKAEADSQIMALLDKLRDGGTRFFRIKATGPTIYTGGVTVKYDLQIDMAAKVKDPGDFGDEDGAYIMEYTLGGVHDETWGKALNVEVINKISAL